MKLSSICSTDNLDEGENEELTQEGVRFLWPDSSPSTTTEIGSVTGKFTDEIGYYNNNPSFIEVKKLSASVCY